ncbi:MAG: HTH-type transcriptional regulator DegA [Fimbriimonadaceae bacterium]|nr:HTH-type transcriptional regulator DegA [Fimbriimonadaceae bacterium]
MTLCRFRRTGRYTGPGMPKGGRASGRATLADVALVAGVSVQTASQVLARTPGVRIAEATRRRVEEAARQVDYVPNRLAQAMRRGKTNVVSVWMPVDRPVITFLRFLNAINVQARTAGYDIMIVGLDSSVAYGIDKRIPHHWPSDGIISYDAGRAIKLFRQTPANREIPTVIMGSEEFEGADTVTWDVAGSAKNLVEQMITMGARQIVHLTTRWVISEFPQEQRRTGYRRAMEAAGLEPVFIQAAGESASDASEAVSEYLDKHAVPEAIFGFTDTLALGALRELHRRGIGVPDDCEVWGFGDFPEGADARIPLSTLRVPLDRLVPAAWTWLAERMEDPTLPKRRESLMMDVVPRRSSRLGSGNGLVS